jgi:rhodanese-related sulfurtransferase
MYIKILSIILTILIISGCSTTTPQKPLKLNDVLKENNIQRVDYKYIKNIVDNLDKKSDIVIFDGRDNKQYAIGHIPSAKLLQYTQYDKEIKKYKLKKSQEIVVYCGGIKCNTSLKLSKKLSQDGYTNVKVYLEGIPEWFDNDTYFEITYPMAKNLYVSQEAIFLNINENNTIKEFEGRTKDISVDDIDSIQIDKREIIVLVDKNSSKRVYTVAQKLVDMGYINVKVLNEDIYNYITKTTKEYTQQNKYVKALAQDIVDTNWLMKYIKDNKLPKNTILVDVRTKNEYKTGHLKGAINIPYKDKKDSQKIYEKVKDKDIAVILYCSTSTRSNESLVDLKIIDKKNRDRYFYIDANIICSEKNICKITQNPLLDF